MSDTITIIGNIAADPDHKRTSNGVPIANFRVASAQRRFDRATGTWIDNGTNWYAVAAFRGLAEHAYQSLHKGDRVIVTGRLRVRDWETDTRRGTAVEIDAEAIGHDLLWGTTTFHKDSVASSTHQAARDDWTVGETDGRPWESTGADPAGVPGADAAAGVEREAAQTARDSLDPSEQPRPLVAAGADAPF
jgi:single-strand DNA-binding protein